MVNSITYPFTLNFRGRLVCLEKPMIMGILNLTPDSFSDGGRYNTRDTALRRVGEMLDQGADIIDIGGYSSRPFAEDISPEEELGRIYPITRAIMDEYPGTLISVDTFRARVARDMLELGVHMINDISGGSLDPAMRPTVAEFQVPYLIMHMQGTPQTMQQAPAYEDVVREVWDHWVDGINLARQAGIRDIIVDPGFGFGKSALHNYQLLHQLEELTRIGLPVMVGISRKSMMYKILDTRPDQVKAATAALHVKALERGAQILRVHDVAEARQVLDLHAYMKAYGVV